MASSSAGDCAFEDDMCGWSNPGPTDGMDELNWERLEARSEQRFPQVSLFILYLFIVCTYWVIGKDTW